MVYHCLFKELSGYRVALFMFIVTIWQIQFTSSVYGMGATEQVIIGSAGEAIIYEAIESDDAEALIPLLSDGLAIDKRLKYQGTLLHLAVEQGSLKIGKVLIEQGADIQAKNPLSEMTPLHLAASFDQKAILELLLDKGAVIDELDLLDQTPLHHAIAKGHHAIIEILLQHGADINIKDRLGQTPLHDAAFKGLKGIVEILLHQGAAINIQDRHGRTALHYAVFGRKKSMVEILLAKGADSAIQDKNGRKPLDYAVDNGISAIIKILKAYKQ